LRTPISTRTAVAEAAIIGSTSGAATRAAAQIVLTRAKRYMTIRLDPQVVSTVSQSTPAVSREPRGGEKAKNQSWRDSAAGWAWPVRLSPGSEGNSWVVAKRLGAVPVERVVTSSHETSLQPSIGFLISEKAK
jgi:hypothetical protein